MRRSRTRRSRVVEAEVDADEDFDRAYPEWVRCLSRIHWTPVSVARRAAELLVTSRSTRVLDVGAGAGKFCIVGALTSGGQFYGVEQSGKLADAARDAAHHHGVDRSVRILHADMTAIDWRRFDAFYFFNPFHEGLGGWLGAMDPSLPFVPNLREDYIRFAQSRLSAAPPGTRVATYNGLGGDMPAEYECVRRERSGTDYLELWLK